MSAHMLGGLWARKDWAVRDPGNVFFGQSDGSHDADGWLGGLQAGCDYQFAGGFVIGIAGDYAWADADGNTSLLFLGSTNHTGEIAGFGDRPHRLAWDRYLACEGRRLGRDEHDFTDGVFSAAVSRPAAAGRSASAVNTHSPTTSPASSSTITTTSADRDLTFAGTGGPFIYGIDETRAS